MWPNLVMFQAVGFRVCWCPTESGNCALATNFKVDLGESFVAGPLHLSNGQAWGVLENGSPNPIAAVNPYVTQPNFVLEVAGEALSPQDEIRVVDASVTCGAAGASTNDASVSGPLQFTIPGAEVTATRAAGQSGDITTTQKFEFTIGEVGAYRVCFCARPAAAGGRQCSADADFNVDAAISFPADQREFIVSGPSAVDVKNDDGQVLTPLAGRAVSVHISGVGLSSGDRIRIVDGDIVCGSADAATHSSHAAGPLTDLDTPGSQSGTGLQRWDQVRVFVGAGFKVCWCAKQGAACDQGAEFDVTAGSFSSFGPRVTNAVLGTHGSPLTSVILQLFDIQVVGVGLSSHNRIRIIDPFMSCGETDAHLFTDKFSYDDTGGNKGALGEPVPGCPFGSGFHQDCPSDKQCLPTDETAPDDCTETDITQSIRFDNNVLDFGGTFRVCFCVDCNCNHEGSDCGSPSGFNVDAGTFEGFRAGGTEERKWRKPRRSDADSIHAGDLWF